MDKFGRISRSIDCRCLSQSNYPRFGRYTGLANVALLLLFALALVSCDVSNNEPDVFAASSVAPTVTVPADITVAATNATGTAAGDPSITVFLNGASAFDTKDGALSAITNDGPAVFPLGVTTVTFSATDSDGNTDNAQATVTVADQTAPLITLLGAAAITLNVGAPFTDPGATANDNVDGDLTLAIVTGGAVNTGVVGLYTLTYDVSDAADNAAAQETRGVSVQTGGTPVVTPPGNITVAAVDAAGTPATDLAIVDFFADVSATDLEDGVIVTITNDAPAPFPLGVTTVTFSATDSSSNTGQAQATVTVTDQTPPVVIAPANITVAATGPSGIATVDAAIVAFLAGASATDNVDDPIATISNNAPGTLPVNVVTTVNFSATDAAGNTGTAQATVKVTPFVSVQLIAFSRDVGGQLDLFAIAEDGSGSPVTLANAAGDEVFAGATGNLIVYVRDNGGQNDIFTINDDGTGGGALSIDSNDELPVAMTADGRVIFMRTLTVPSTQSDLLSIKADGSGGEISLANSMDAELFDRLAPGGRVIFQRIEGGTQFDIYSNLADGTGSLVPLAVTAAIDEVSAGMTGGGVIAFARTVGLSDNDIFTISADGVGGESSLVSTPDDEIPVDVTAGGRVVFIRSDGFAMNLFSINATGTGGETQLTTTGDILFYGGSTKGERVIYNRLDLFTFQYDVFSRNADGSGVEATLAADLVNSNEEFSGISSDGKVIITRTVGTVGTVGAQTNLIAINADGTGPEIPLAIDPASEVFLGVTDNGRVIFGRDSGGLTDLYSILADGSGLEVLLATDVSFGGIF
jgi:hypothetical protein